MNKTPQCVRKMAASALFFNTLFSGLCAGNKHVLVYNRLHEDAYLPSLHLQRVELRCNYWKKK